LGVGVPVSVNNAGVDDPFGTAAIRDRVLAAWQASPARFREDANTEEDLALGGYRDRLIVELAQNAADAAARAGVPGRLRFTPRDDERARAESGGPVLVAANVGAPLTAPGVEALATLRASAKRDEVGQSASADQLVQPVGRFGVGFAAVLAVTDEPTIVSRSGGVRFSRADTVALVEQAATAAPGLQAELRRRGGHVPVLRLPFPAEGEPPEGFDTAVVLPLRDEAAADLVRQLLAQADDALLLALPRLERIEIDVDGSGVRVLADVDKRWHSYRRGGTWNAEERARLLADRPTEERDRPFWSVLWALPKTSASDAEPLLAGPGAPGARRGAGTHSVVHAPTPTDELLSLPAMLLASFPLDPTRRHVAPGPLTDRLVEEAATAYAELVRQRAEAGDDVVGLVPVGLAAGPLDAALREAILGRLPDTPLLPTVAGGLVRPRDAVAVEGADDSLLRLLAPVVSGLVSVRPRDRAAYDALGVRRLSLADLVDELAGHATAFPPRWWHDLYVALASTAADPSRRDALGALPVPLVDGRVVRGARGLLVPGATGVPTQALAVLAPYGLRLAHPEAAADAAAETLVRLGAVTAGPRALLDDGAVRAAVESSLDADDSTAVSESVLSLVAAALDAGELTPGELPWLGDLALLDADGQAVSANGLVLPGSPAQEILDPEEFSPVNDALLERWGPEVLQAVGVARGLSVVTASDVDVAALPDTLADLDDIEAWADAAVDALASEEADDSAGVLGARVDEMTAIRDLDFVRDDAWPRALSLLAGERETRQALAEPVRVRDVEDPDRVVRVSSYSAWWIRRHVRIDGQPMAAFADPDADPAVATLLAQPPAWVADLDPGIRAALGLVRGIGDLDARGVRRILARLADPNLAVPVETMLALWAQFEDLDPSALAGPAPERVRVLTGDRTQVVAARDAVVVDDPMWAQRTDLGGQVLASGAAADTLADLLDVPLASESAEGVVSDDGVRLPVPTAVRRLLPTSHEPGGSTTTCESTGIRSTGGSTMRVDRTPAPAKGWRERWRGRLAGGTSDT
jgi:hypothetical protein